MAYPTHYGLPQVPQQFQQGYGGNPQSLQMMLAYLLAQRQEGQQDDQFPQQEAAIPINPYAAQPFRPSLSGLSPLGRFNDMALRQSANLADRMGDAKAAVSEGKERQRLVDSITHPPPMAPYNISSPQMSMGTGEQNFPNGAPLALASRYGRGGVSFAPPGTAIHGTFGPDNLPFGQIGGAKEGLPLPGGDPGQETFQQQMIMDSVAKALGKGKKK